MISVYTLMNKNARLTGKDICELTGAKMMGALVQSGCFPPPETKQGMRITFDYGHYGKDWRTAVRGTWRVGDINQCYLWGVKR